MHESDSDERAEKGMNKYEKVSDKNLFYFLMRRFSNFKVILF